MIPVIDLFAGPGGLGEGFSAFSAAGNRVFRVVLSVEKDPWARETLKLRSFFRQFPRSEVPEEYYACLAGRITRGGLYSVPHLQAPANAADREAMLAELGRDDAQIQDAIAGVLGQREHEGTWVLIGGPPCQAYSVVGRARRRGEDPNRFASDPRHELYRHYLNILATYQPAVFVMENVKGLLSAELHGTRIFDRILTDLRDPGAAGSLTAGQRGATYRICACVDYSGNLSIFDDVRDPSQLVVKCELHGIPQRRHRVVLVGIREDIPGRTMPLDWSDTYVSTRDAIGDLPAVRSKLSSGGDERSWARAILGVLESAILDHVGGHVRGEMQRAAGDLGELLCTGSEHFKACGHPTAHHDWFSDPRLEVVCNHSTRAHMESDLQRYFFAACFAAVHGESPRLEDFPSALRPKHSNVMTVDREDMIFRDRFRVQLAEQPATTITSHIGKDGHAFIHYDALQCRSFTVREAARLQTFPDNYFFVGPRTSQYQQVGNAVPPLLAIRIAEMVYRVVAPQHKELSHGPDFKAAPQLEHVAHPGGQYQA